MNKNKITLGIIQSPKAKSYLIKSPQFYQNIKNNVIYAPPGSGMSFNLSKFLFSTLER